MESAFLLDMSSPNMEDARTTGHLVHVASIVANHDQKLVTIMCEQKFPMKAVINTVN